MAWPSAPTPMTPIGPVIAASYRSRVRGVEQHLGVRVGAGDDCGDALAVDSFAGDGGDTGGAGWLDVGR
ncbi:hypothetical protein J7E69_19375 [Rhodococcus enclensis]|nr:hypothetical protein [Rhodococcus qingshengii]